MDYPEKRRITWIDDETGDLVGACDYYRHDLLEAARAEIERLTKERDEARAMLADAERDMRQRAADACLSTAPHQTYNRGDHTGSMRVIAQECSNHILALPLKHADREGAEAMRVAAIKRVEWSYINTDETGPLLFANEAIRAIAVDEVLADTRPRCNECDEGILPCPFCGGPAEITEIDDGENAGGSCVCCTKCLASGNVEFGFKENFVSNWNRRVQTPAPNAVARLVEAARAGLNYLENTEGEFGITLGSATGLRAALAEMEKGMSEWQPIDTAPKDGEMILVCLPRMMNLIVRARFNTVHKYWVTDYEGEGGIKVPHFFHPGDVWLPMPECGIWAAHGSDYRRL